jgi:hypothetical protein
MALSKLAYFVAAAVLPMVAIRACLKFFVVSKGICVGIYSLQAHAIMINF